MSSAVYVARAFLANLLCLPPQRLYRVFFDRDVGRNNQLQIGDCRFWGPKEFTAICQSAMDELQIADEKLFAELTSSGMITFWLKPPTLKRRVYDKAARFYNIDPVYHARSVCLIKVNSDDERDDSLSSPRVVNRVNVVEPSGFVVDAPL